MRHGGKPPGLAKVRVETWALPRWRAGHCPCKQCRVYRVLRAEHRNFTSTYLNTEAENQLELRRVKRYPQIIELLDALETM